ARARLVIEGVPAEQMSERMAGEVGIPQDRIARLLEALEALGDKAERVRLVRVFAAEHQPPGAKKVGEFNYVIDLQPEALPPGRGDRRGGRGGDRGHGGPAKGR